jgi:hypothetical protein
MARTERVRYFKAHLENKPGSLLELMRQLKAKNLGLRGLWGYASDGSTAEVYVVPKSPEKLRKLWTAAGLLQEEGVGFWLKGIDRTGALNKSLEALAEAGVNIDCVDAVSVGRQFGSFIWVDPSNIEKAALALKAK